MLPPSPREHGRGHGGNGRHGGRYGHPERYRGNGGSARHEPLAL